MISSTVFHDIPLNNEILPSALRIYETLDSTNRLLINSPVDFCESHIIASREQTAGKGRMNRNWLSGYDKGLWFSFYLPWEIYPPHLLIFSLALAIRDFLIKEDIDPGAILLKWPNDIMINRKKVAGILMQSRMQTNKIIGIYTGIGVNLNYTNEDIPQDIRAYTTSLLIEDGKKRDIRNDLTIAIQTIDKYLSRRSKKHYSDVMPLWRKATMTKGDKILISRKAGEKVMAVYQDVNDNGALIVKIADKTEEILTADVGVI